MKPTLTPGEEKKIRHALGLNGRAKITYRNFYYAAGFDADAWRELVKRGLAVEGKSGQLATWFHVTRAGWEAVKRKKEKLGPDEEAMMAKFEREGAA